MIGPVRLLPALPALLLAMLSAQSALADTPGAFAAQAFRVGQIDVVALRDGSLTKPNDGKTFGVDAGPAAVAATLRKAGLPLDSVEVSTGALLVKTGGRVLLLDTGLGHAAPTTGLLMDSLAKAGVKPESVNDILLTHSHGDHVGGLLTPSSGLAFPNATIHLSTAEWASMQAQQGPMQALVAAITPKVVTFAPGDVIAPGVRSVDIPGHTPGHVGYEIGSGAARLLDVGDTVHSSVVSLAHPEWTMGFDGDADLGKASRRALLAKLAARHELIYAPHFPFPSTGRIAKAATGYRWEPALR